MTSRSTKPIKPVSATFKKFIGTTKANGVILPAAERYMLSKPRDTSRSTTVLHPSEMSHKNWCARASYFLLQGAEPAPLSAARRGLKTHLTFQMGHLIHDLWQTLFADMGILYGTWKCVRCDYKVSEITNTPACPNCTTNAKFSYAEVPVISKEYRISGKADGIIVPRDSEPLLIEIKSMSKGTFLFEDRDAWYASGQNYEVAWKNFNSPFATHVLQAQLYMKFLADSELAPKQVLFIYHSKADNEVKEFIVNRSNFGITEILAEAAKIIKAIDADVPPACNVNGPTKCSKCEVY